MDIANELHVGSLARFLKSGSMLCRVVDMNDDGTFMVVRVATSRSCGWADGTRKKMLATTSELERISECAYCDRPIKPGREVWLEYDAVTDLFHQPGEVPEVPEGHESRGLFALGTTCARKQIERVKRVYAAKKQNGSCSARGDL